MMAARWIFAVAIAASTVASADGLKPPTGWKRASAEAEQARVAAVKKKADDQVAVEVKEWNADGSKARGAMWTRMVMPRSFEGTAAELADGMLGDIVAAYERNGLAVTSTKAPKVKGQAVVARVFEGMGLRLYVQVRAFRKGNKVHVIIAMCGDDAKADACKRAMTTITAR